MPANPKYLTTSNFQRLGKVLAAFPLAYILSAAIHLAFACWLDRRVVVATTTYSLFIVWAGLMFVPFVMKSGWKCCALFIIFSALFIVLANAGHYHLNFPWK